MPPGIVGTSFLFCVSARLLGPDSTSEIYGPATLPDRRSVGIESETTQTGIDWGAPRVPPRLREARRSRVGESDQFRPLPSQAATCSKRHIACKLPHEEHQFSATISETRFSHRRRPARIYRSRGGGRGGWNVPTAAGSMTKEAALLLFNSVRSDVNTIDRISFACTQGRIETE